MAKYFSIGEAAKSAHTTTETLRHYDRIGLVKPSMRDEWTNYRYYTEEDIVRINTVRALQLMDLHLREIKNVLEYEDLNKIIDFLEEAEKKADQKIASLEYSKSKIHSARLQYERNLKVRNDQNAPFIREMPERVILLSDTLESPSLDNLWNYLSHFYEKIPPDLREKFQFEDIAGIYTEEGKSRLFAVCDRYVEIDGLRMLPGGRYLCMDCTEKERKTALNTLIDMARAEYGADPSFTVQIIVVSGILHWNYEIQAYVGK